MKRTEIRGNRGLCANPRRRILLDPTPCTTARILGPRVGTRSGHDRQSSIIARARRTPRLPKLHQHRHISPLEGNSAVLGLWMLTADTRGRDIRTRQKFQGNADPKLHARVRGFSAHTYTHTHHTLMRPCPTANV